MLWALIILVIFASSQKPSADLVEHNLRSSAAANLQYINVRPTSKPAETAMRGLGESTSTTNSLRRTVIDDVDDEDYDEGPDIWDILIWIGAWLGRVARTVLVGIVKLCYALYSGIQYGWESAKPKDLP